MFCSRLRKARNKIICLTERLVAAPFGAAENKRSAVIITINNYKNLSLNRNGLTPTNDGTGQLQETFIALFEFFIANGQFSKPIEPTMASFNLPTSQTSRRIGMTFRRPSALLHCWRIPCRRRGVPRRGARVPVIAAQVFRPDRRLYPQDASLQRLGQQRHIRRLRAADDQRQRDATPVDQQAARAPVFSPDPWDWGRRHPAPEELCSTSHQCVAMSTRSRPIHHIRRDRPARAVQRNQRPASAKHGDEWRSRCQTVPWAMPSIGCRFAARTRFQQRPVEAVRACVLRQACGHSPASDHAAARESTVRPSAKTHLRRAMMESSVFVSWHGSLVYSAIFVNHYLGIYSKDNEYVSYERRI